MTGHIVDLMALAYWVIAVGLAVQCVAVVATRPDLTSGPPTVRRRVSIGLFLTEQALMWPGNGAVSLLTRPLLRENGTLRGGRLALVAYDYCYVLGRAAFPVALWCCPV